jgi:hypothetical protein
MEHLSERHDDDGLRNDIHELRLAVGLENIESTGRQSARRVDLDDPTPETSTDPSLPPSLR